MTDQELLNRIAANPKIMVGKPVIKGTRLTVEYILNLLAHGATVTEIIAEYEGLEVLFSFVLEMIDLITRSKLYNGC